MFQPIHLLPLYEPKERDRLQDRWNTTQGQKDKEHITELIKRGAGEDFLQGDFENDRLPTLKDDHDLSGIDIWSLEIDFPKHDNFEAIDFSYSKWWHSKFKGGLFYVYLNFARVYNCEFRNSTFYFFEAYGTTFEKCKFINCDFIEHSHFSNCEFLDCEFKGPFFTEKPFQDCLFDNSTHIFGNIENAKIQNTESSSFTLELKAIPEIFKSIKNAYLSGEVHNNYRKYYFLQKQAERKNSTTITEKLYLYLKEAITGYGIKPQNTLVTTAIVVLIFAVIFAFDKQATMNPILTSMSAFATVGSLPSTS
ncbi:MAG: hypothetical protein WAV56_04205, partial [Microgenomates group bacterium]